MAKITDAQMQVLINCIGAVETGGQVYGKRRYDDYTNAYTNSSAEDSITIGAFQEFKGYAKALLQEIKDTYPSTFKKYDNADIASDLKKTSWTGYNPAKTSAKAKAIVAIISSEDGKKVQDTRIVKLLNQYISYAESLGVTDTDALFMCANFIHQGGNSACKRLVGKITKPYTLDKLYNATLTDTGNQVGTYKTRQKKMYTWIKQYVTNNSQSDDISGGNKMTENELRNKVANWLVQYLGIKEGSTQHKAILATFNNSKLSTRYTMTVNDAWCATSVSAAFIAAGLAGKAGSGSLFECCECSCYYMVQKAIAQGIWVESDSYIPKVGDIVLYDWQDSGIGDNTGNPDHVGIVVSSNGSTFKVIEGNISNSVGYRTMNVNGKYIRGFIAPKYSKFASGTSTTPTTTTKKPAATENKSYVGKGVGYATSLCAINVRSGASKNYSSYGVIEKGTKVEVLEILTNGWYKIVWTKASCGYAYTSNSNGKYYTYVANKVTTTTTTKKSTNSGLNRTQQWVGKVTADTLNVRSWAGTEYANIKSYPKLGLGNLVAVCDTVKDSKGANWYYVLIADKYYGFVHSNYIQRV